jgi:hypothetical protein
MIKDRSMYTVLFPSGKILVLGNRSIADTYISAYQGILISGPENQSNTNPLVTLKY